MAVDAPPTARAPRRGTRDVPGSAGRLASRRARVGSRIRSRNPLRPRFLTDVGESIRVPLAELRRSVDPEGRAVRAAGATLGRAGALLSPERSSAGPVWVIDPQRIPFAPGETTSLPTRGASEAPQPS